MATHITTYANLQAMSNDLTEDYILDNDIDCDGETNFTPVGNGGGAFTGSFDGGNYTISNFTVSQDAQYNGLFGRVDGVTIENLRLSGDVTDTGSNTWTGGLIGLAQTTTVTNCHVNVNVTGFNHVGGLIGLGGTTVSNCSSAGTVTGAANAGAGNVGGLVGSSGIDFTDCYVTGNVIGKDVAGFTAAMESATRCYVTGNVTANIASTLLFGFGSPDDAIDCYSTGDVDANGSACSQISGFGTVGAGDLVQNCYSTGNVESSDAATIIGGFTALIQGETENCYTTGTLSGKGGATFAGGFVGFKLGSVTNCYFTDAGSDNGQGTLEGGGISAFYPKTHNVYDSNAPFWDFSVPDNWYAHKAALPTFIPGGPNPMVGNTARSS